VIWPFSRTKVDLDPASRARRDALQRLPAADLGQPLAALRWCVVDVETGGLNAERDPLLSIGAVAVEGGRIVLGESFEIGLAQAESTDAANILIHGISGSEQRAGQAPQGALLDWLEFAQASTSTPATVRSPTPTPPPNCGWCCSRPRAASASPPRSSCCGCFARAAGWRRISKF
jgi:hypothetical protein